MNSSLDSRVSQLESAVNLLGVHIRQLFETFLEQQRLMLELMKLVQDGFDPTHEKRRSKIAVMKDDDLTA